VPMLFVSTSIKGTTGDHKGPPLGINVRPYRGFCMGEGGWVDGWMAFMVARRGLPEDIGSSMKGPYPLPTGDHKGPPNPASSTLAPTVVDFLFLS
jgi:hypothetical protein